jgi:hypothetical protein
VINRIQSFLQPSIFLLIILFSSCEPPIQVSLWDAIDSNNTLLVLESRYSPSLPDKNFESFFLKKDYLYLSTVQRSSKNDFDILYSYLMTKDLYDSLLISKSNLKNQKIIKRLLNGIEICEVKSDHKEGQLTFAYISGIFVVSKSSLLIENAIRVFQSKEKRSFKSNNSELFQFPSLKSDHGNVYVNNDNFSEIYSQSLLKSIPLLKEFKSLSVYDLKSDSRFLSLNGFSVGINSSLSLFQNQKPVALKVARYVPNYSTFLVDFGISDFYSFGERLDSAFLKTFPIGSEIAFVSTEDNENGLLAFVEFKSGSSSDFDFITSYSETYSNCQIRSVNGDVLKQGFGEIFPDVLFGFCTVRDNYLILSQSVDEIKSLIDAIESDDTWGKTLDYQKFSDKGLQESNVTLIFKKPTLFSGQGGILQEYAGLIDSIGLSQISWQSIQMSALDNHFYSSVNFSLGSTAVKSQPSKQNSKSSFLEMPASVQFASLVKNHTTGLQEILIQDSDLMVSLVSLNDGIIWRKQMDSHIQGSLDQLDFFKNGKLQYFFSTKSNLYMIDRLGRDVSGFPKSLPSPAKFSGLVDYDKSKNYRLLISLMNNDVYLFDKEGNKLTNWDPKKFEGEIATPPSHMKIGGKDFFIVFLIDGTVHVFNRKGDRIDSFQLKDKKPFSGDYYLESGMSSSTTYLYYISNEGTVTKQNLKGEILTSENLLRGKNSKFILRRTATGDKFYFYRVDVDKIAVFNKEGSIVFEKQNSGSTNLQFQCIGRGNNKMVFSFFDIEQRLVQVFDESGNSLIQTPIESDVSPLFGLGKSRNEFGIYAFPRNSVIFNAIR